MFTPLPGPVHPPDSLWNHPPLRWSLWPHPVMERPHPNAWKSLISFPTLVWRRQRDQAFWRELYRSSSEASPRSLQTPYSPVLLASMQLMPLCWQLPSLVSGVLIYNVTWVRFCVHVHVYVIHVRLRLSLTCTCACIGGGMYIILNASY